MDLSIIIPTYNEKENIESLLNGIYHELNKNNLKGEVIIVDDNSPDRTAEVVENLITIHKNLILIQRRGKLGLSSAIIEGFKKAKSEVLCVMDADLSHSSEEIPKMFNIIKEKNIDLVIGSRYIKKGKIIGWGFFRKFESKIATLMARVFTSVKDPMTGFFMIKKECIKNKNLDPKGFKILLEILVKCDCKKIKEMPITFNNRVNGKSKSGIKEILYYLQNLSKYLIYRKDILAQFIKFGAVGLIGTGINLLVLYLLTDIAGVYYILSAFFAFMIAMTSNFILNKIWSFKENIKKEFKRKWAQFFIISIAALVVNLTFLYILTDLLKIYYIISQILAIGLATIINFLGNKIWTFSK